MSGVFFDKFKRSFAEFFLCFFYIQNVSSKIGFFITFFRYWQISSSATWRRQLINKFLPFYALDN